MKNYSLFTLRLSGIALLMTTLAACSDRDISAERMERFNQPDLAAVKVKPSSLAVNLQVDRNGQGLTPESLAAVNQLLKQQGRLEKQTLTLTPWTPRGEQLANRLANALQNAGADKRHVRVMGRVPSAGRGGDLQLQSQALAVTNTRCQINDPNLLMVKPYEAVGYLGCANQSNLAQMVADPRDLIQARSLDDADGVVIVNSIERYQQNEVKDLIDINFDED
ncbi:MULTISPECIES: CpaD family pilus assembly lipoprotein [Erwiniaceae]|uniref:CpaD family pilus assembly lipoprotein n=1 Tax=Erwiniaceae TaxID=1903409 RepID=UPI00190B89F2|nr:MULTISPECIES: CpaD family pilus assembly lipoprotein [Erwiniaceae]MBK0000503.1 CpaD family pilus assembly lipoprotein [Erwinia sp. S38]MBM7341808.1 pilus assembly protein CpaD [Pantoea coffeiphila]